MKLSVIIPVYNVEKYILQCLESVYKLGVNDIEYIIINDGSTDSSYSIIQLFEHKAGIKIINQKNKGLAAARNVGLKYAIGDYVYFLDSDDFIDPNSFLQMLRYTQFEYDIIIGDYFDYESADKYKLNAHRLDANGETILGNGIEFLHKHYRRLSSVVWRNIYKREFLLSNELFFYEGIYFEDVEWMPKVYYNATAICYTSIAFYYYRKRQDSIMTSNLTLKKLSDSYMVCKSLSFESQYLNDSCSKQIFILNGLHCLFHILSKYKGKITVEFWNDLEQYLSVLKVNNLKYKFAIFVMGISHRLFLFLLQKFIK